MEKFKIAYKLLNDLLFFLLVFFAAQLVAESLLPGVVSDQIALFTVAFLILICVLAINYLGNKLEIKKVYWSNKKTAFLAALFLVILSINGLLKINWLANLLITATALLSAYFVLKVLAKED